MQIYEGALNAVRIDIGFVGTGGLAWAVLAPTAGVPAGALAGTYVGASGDIAVGAGIVANVLVSGSNRNFRVATSFARQFGSDGCHTRVVCPSIGMGFLK
jgi:hypothetical protein